MAPHFHFDSKEIMLRLSAVAKSTMNKARRAWIAGQNRLDLLRQLQRDVGAFAGIIEHAVHRHLREGNLFANADILDFLGKYFQIVNQVSQRLGVHFPHQVSAMNLYGGFAGIDFRANLFVEHSSHYERHDLPLSR